MLTSIRRDGGKRLPTSLVYGAPCSIRAFLRSPEKHEKITPVVQAKMDIYSCQFMSKSRSYVLLIKVTSSISI